MPIYGEIFWRKIMFGVKTVQVYSEVLEYAKISKNVTPKIREYSRILPKNVSLQQTRLQIFYTVLYDWL